MTTPSPPGSTRSAHLVDSLQWRAQNQPARLAYRFVAPRADDTCWSYADLDRFARRVGGALQRRLPRGERVLLWFPPGLDFLAAFLGCQYAGMVAVPTYPPNLFGLKAAGTDAAAPSSAARQRLSRTMQRVCAIAEDCGATAVLTTGAISAVRPLLQQVAPPLGTLQWVDYDALDDGHADAWQDGPRHSEDPAFLQYTSGSTGDPKGVVISHRNLASNAAAIREFACFDPERDVGVSWLPPYHDMGLIGNMLQQVYEGYPQILMAPATFMKRPLRWLEAISKYRATISAAPNFAFDLCVDRIKPEQRDGLDLSCLRLVVSGAEPVRARTVSRFTSAFAGCGFSRAAFAPCYGLAESTLIVSGGHGARLGSLAPGPGAASHDEASEPHVSCGPALGGARIVIVDPDTRHPVPDGSVGEVWVQADHVGQGYYGRPDATRQVFAARLRNGEGPFLRTGDLGALQDGELFVTGRIKELMIFGGANHHPHDVEATVARALDVKGHGSLVAFSVERSEDARLVLGLEVSRLRRDAAEELEAKARAAVSRDHALPLHELVFLRPGGVPRTTSGKLQRGLARKQYQAGLMTRAEVLG